jgi:F0F1-type ATP synthase epsilon subunit
VKLTLISPQHKHEYTVQWIEAQTPVGAIVIKPDHAPIILSLVAGSDFSFVLDTDEKKIIRLLRPGFLEVDRDHATMLMGQEN